MESRRCLNGVPELICVNSASVGDILHLLRHIDWAGSASDCSRHQNCLFVDSQRDVSSPQNLMCGIVAVLCLEPDKICEDEKGSIEGCLHTGLEQISHRGPDGSGIWVDPDGRCGEYFGCTVFAEIIGLAHCRLSINDLSPSGSQPLHSSDNKVHAIVNGEIYDTEKIRSTLTPEYNFMSSSDSEIVLALYATLGLDFLSHLRGEFGFCLYDSEKDIFIAGRDRYGIKPMFWRRSNNRIWFGAEIKAFLGSDWEPEWDVDSITSMGWGQDTRTLFKGVQKVGRHLA